MLETRKAICTAANCNQEEKAICSKTAEEKIELADETILTPNFARLIREARMKMGLTHEQLGMKMNEKAQLLKKFETGSLKPDEIFAKKLERYLGIKLYVSINNDEE